MSETTTPDLGTVILAAISARLKNVRVALPGRIESYDATTQQAVVQPLVYEGVVDATGVRQAERLPAIAGVPVVFPGGGGFRITFPIAKGDTVLLVFTSSSSDLWKALGGEVDPVDDRRHHISDAIAIGGLHDFAHPLATASTTKMSMGKDGGGPTIEISGTDVQIGGSNNLVTRSEFLNHGHVIVATGAVSPCPGPVTGSTPGSAGTFPGTQTLKGG